MKAYKITSSYQPTLRITKRPIMAASARDVAKGLIRTASSNIWAFMIDIASRKDKTGTLYVQFKNKRGGPGDIYCYYDFPVVMYRKWLSATSKGHFFWLYIRNNYKYSKLTGDRRGRLSNAVNR